MPSGSLRNAASGVRDTFSLWGGLGTNHLHPWREAILQQPCSQILSLVSFPGPVPSLEGGGDHPSQRFKVYSTRYEVSAFLCSAQSPLRPGQWREPGFSGGQQKAGSFPTLISVPLCVNSPPRCPHSCRVLSIPTPPITAQAPMDG